MTKSQCRKGPGVVSFTQYQNGTGLAVKKVPDLKREPVMFGLKKALHIFAIAALVVAGLNFPPSGAVRAVAVGTLNLPVTIRDFHGVGWSGSDGYSAHPDFEITPIPGDDRGIVQSTLGGDSKPVYATTTGTTLSTHGKDAFNQWYNDTTHVNTSTPYSLTFTKVGNVYQYNNASFFPIDNHLLGNDGRSHNFHFTLELHSQFAYQTGQTFNFTGDDDVWVFINDTRVIDIGGVHSAESASVNLDTLGLTPGQNYSFDLFFAERHTTESNFKAETNIALDVCGNIPGIQTSVPSGMSSDVQGNCGYQVTFDKNGGDTDANPTTELAIANGNTNVGTLPTAPTKTDYTFDSWNTQADGLGATFDGSTLVTASITVYAKWTITPVDGGWTGWGECSATCGGGTQTRTCTNPTPVGSGADCSNLDGGNSSQACNVQDCSSPVDTTFHFIKAVCPAWSDVAGNAYADVAQYDATGGNYTQFSNYSATAPHFPDPYSPKPINPIINPSEIPTACSKQTGWSFKFSPDQGQTTNVSNIGPTDGNGETSIKLSQMVKPQRDALTSGGQLWVSEDLSAPNKPNDSSFAALRCYNDAVNGDNLEYITLGTDQSAYPPDVYCIAYNVEPAEQTCDGTTNLVGNGGFETPVVSGDWDIFPTGTVGLIWSAIWTSDDASTYNSQSRPDLGNAELQKNVSGWAPSESLQYTELDSDWNGPNDPLNGEPANVLLSQFIPTESGANYILSFDYSPRPGHADNQLRAYWNGLPVDATLTADGSGNSNTVWTHKQYTVAGTGGSTALEFKEVGAPDSLGMFLDNVKLVKDCSTPEPTGDLTICKYNDVNKNGIKDEGDTPLQWPFTVTYPNQGTLGTGTNGETGCVTIAGLPLGDYAITEADDNNTSDEISWVKSNPQSGSQTVTLIEAGTTATFLNYQRTSEGGSSADLSMDKSVNNATPNPVDTVIYTLTVHNGGPDTATGVVATDTLSSFLTFVSASSTQGSYDSATGLWTVGTLANGASATLEIKTTVNNSVSGGQQISNEGIVSAIEADPNPSDNTDSAGIIIPSTNGGGGGCTSNCGGTSGTSSGGSGVPSGPTGGAVSGISTGPSLAMPPGQVLGATTELPRTGVPVGFTLLVLAALAAIFDRKLKLI